MTNYDFYYLVGGTNKERHDVAKETGISINAIRIVNRSRDMLGFRGGKIIFGNTGIVEDLEEILAYAHTHEIEVP